MATIRELDTVFHIRYYDRSRQPSEVTDSLRKDEWTKAEAEEEATLRGILYRRGQYDPWIQDAPGAAARGESMTLMDAVEQYTTERREAGRRGERGGWTEKSFKSDGGKLRQFARSVGSNRLLSSVDVGDIRRWVYTDGIAETTKAQRHVVIAAMFRWMKDRGWIAEMPDLPAKPVRRRTIRTTITADQLEAICRAYERLVDEKLQEKHTTHAGVDWFPDGWRVLFWQGLRRSELLNLRVSHVDLDDSYLQIGDRDWVQKGKDETLIPLVDEARGVLKPYVCNREPGERVFSTPPTNDRVSRHFKEAVRFARTEIEEDRPGAEGVLHGLDFESVDLYTLRHSCATQWLRRGKPLVWVRYLLRHKQIDTTMHYVHLLPPDAREMYRLDQ